MKIEQLRENLDCMDEDTLHKLGRAYGTTLAERVFPSKQDGYKAAFKNLQTYAVNKALAITYRKHGEINKALRYESTCDLIYSDLPDFARFF